MKFFFTQTITTLLIILFLNNCQTEHFQDPLTIQEREWLKQQAQKIKIAVEINYAPFVFIDDIGISKGIATEFIELIEKKLNFRLKKIKAKSFNEILKKAHQKEIDVVNAVTKTPNRSEYLLFTKPFSMIPNVIISKILEKGLASINDNERKDIKNKWISFSQKTPFEGKEFWIFIVTTFSVILLIISVIVFWNRILKKQVEQRTTLLQEELTERKKAEEALVESKEKYRSLTEDVLGSSAVGVFILDSDFKVAWVNGALERFFALRKDDIIGKDKRQLIKDNIASIFKDSEGFIQKVFDTYDNNTYIEKFECYIIPAANRQGRWLEHWSQPIKTGLYAGGRVEHYTDITDRKQAEENTRNTSNILSLYIKHSPIYAFLKEVSHTDTRVLYVSDNYIDMIGIPASQMFGKTMAELFPIEFAEKITRDDIDVVLKGKNLKVNEDFNGRNYVTYKFPILQGDKKYLAGYTVDITELKQTESALRESEERLKMVLDGSQLGFWDWNIETNMVIRNERWAGMLGYTLDDIERNVKQWTDLIHPDDRGSAWQSIKDHLENRTPFHNIEYRMCTKNGDYRWILDQAKIVKRDSGGNPLRMSGTHTDITEIKKLQIILNQAQKMEAIGTLAGGIAHDFNNMLSVITGNISYAMNNLDKDDALFEILSDVDKSAKQAQSLTNQLLTFSKGGEPIKKITNINQLINEAAIFSLRGAKSKCKFELSDDLWATEVDEGQINQVISNLVINADQAMPNGGMITVRTQNVIFEAKNDLPFITGRCIKIRIEDQGMGISKNYTKNIFEPYFTTKQKGSGLGLATVYSIIKKHGGHITFYSEIEKGTVFTIFLPASTEDVIEIEEKPEPKHLGNGKILIMDDQEAILKMVGRMLSGMGYETVFATNGSEAIEIYKEALSSENPFDLVILDLTVPGGMGGARTIPELLKIDPKVKAVVSSGYSNDPIMANYKDYGFYGIMPKPYTQYQLAEVLNKLFDKASQQFPQLSS